jgi:DNA topoisomerase-1
LRLIVEREIEIEQFEPKEYWRLIAETEKDQAPIQARLTQYQGEKLTQFSINNEKDANAAQKALLKAANGQLTVAKVEKKARKRNPAPPFITSTLQQEASRKIGFGATRTMRTAQSLYEGVKIDGTEVGLISYMRTDSTTLAGEAIDAIRALIEERYGKDNLPEAPRVYKTKAKNAQEAHEAIRPTDVIRTPDAIKQYLNDDQFKLYRLIWNRTIACQMIHATLNTVAVDLICASDKQHVFRANGSTIANPGFMLVYQEGVDDAKAQDQDEKMLPPLKEGEVLSLKDIQANQHFTEPPPRFSEASLVKSLEEFGIGRPSTYASIISTLQFRKYVTLEQKRFHPSDVGRVVNRFLTEYFTQYVDYDFTAKMEDSLDAISDGQAQREAILGDFWTPFKTLIDKIETTVERKDVVQESIDEKCPECQNPLSIRLGRNGRFIGCTTYPECRYTRGMDDEEGSSEPEVVEGRSCPKCESDLVIKVGRYGKFIGCSGYPKCKHIESLEKPDDTEIPCPECKKGSLLKKRSRRGSFFYSCSTYPDCKYAIWDLPQAKTCPQCEWPILTIKTTKRRGTERVCPQKSCDFAEPYETEEEK